MDEDLSIRGTLEESSLPELLRSICKGRESGVLTCYMDDFAKSIYVSDGQILFAGSTNEDDRLGESLLRYGKITVRHFLDGSKMVRPGRRLGSILCEMKAITPEELVEGVRVQVRDIIRSLFCRTTGQYELLLKKIDTQEMILLGMTTEDIIFDGVKSIQSWSRISKHMGSFSGRVVLGPDADKISLNLTLSNEEAHLFSLCSKGQLTMEEICGLSYLTNFDTCRVLYGFMMVGALRAIETTEAMVGDTPASEPSSSWNAELDLSDLVESYNDLFAHLFDYAFQRLGEGAEALAGVAMGQVRESLPDVLGKLQLDTYGRMDFDAVLMQLRTIPEEQRMPRIAGAMEEILYALLFEIGSHFGPEDQKKLTREIQAMRKR
jgi:hypothetical protein